MLLLLLRLGKFLVIFDWSGVRMRSISTDLVLLTQYIYDTKFEQNAYGALLVEYSKVYGTDYGKKLHIGESSTLDKTYVGGDS